MSEAVLGFQIVIFLSILATRLVARDKLIIICAGWTIFTMFMVFTSRLMWLQLFVIWGSYLLVSAIGGSAQGPRSDRH